MVVTMKSFFHTHFFFLLALLATISYSQNLGPSGAITSFNAGGQYIMLTFSEGPHSVLTPMILDTLKKKKVKATFFVLGTRAASNTELLQRMVNEGHEIGNNGWGEILSKKLPYEQLRHDIRVTARIIRNVTSTTTKFFRPVGGKATKEMVESLKKDVMYPMKTVLWSIDTLDARIHVNDTSIISSVTSNAKPGAIVNFHDNKRVNLSDVVLPQIIDKLYEDGYEFLTLSQMASFPDDSPHRRS